MNTKARHWVDYEFWQNLICEFGQIGLEQRPSYCNRGRFVIKTLTDCPANRLLDLINGSYFFNEDFAKQEIYAWLDLTKSAITNDSIQQLNFAKVEKSQKLVWGHNGRNCEIAVHKASLKPVQGDIYIAKLIVNSGSELELFVDWADGWNRIYLDEKVAYSEITAWLICRKQV